MKCRGGYEMGKKSFCQECGARPNEGCPNYVEPTWKKVTFTEQKILGGLRFDAGTYEFRSADAPDDEVLF